MSNDFHFDQSDHDLVKASMRSDFILVNELVSSKSYHPDVLGMALDFAVKVNNLQIADILINKGANINYFEGSPLASAAVNGNENFVRYLLGRGADIHAGEDVALCSAVGNGHEHIVKLLLKAGANRNARFGEPFKIAEHGGFNSIKRILKETEDIRIRSKSFLAAFWNLLSGR